MVHLIFSLMKILLITLTLNLPAFSKSTKKIMLAQIGHAFTRFNKTFASYKEDTGFQ